MKSACIMYAQNIKKLGKIMNMYVKVNKSMQKYAQVYKGMQ